MEFRHPNYYKKLKASLKKTAISPEPATAKPGRAPNSDKQQASSVKLPDPQAASDKHQA